MTQCHEIMKRSIECLSSRDTAIDAARAMRDQNIGFLPVCDKEMKVLGTVTDRDIAIRLVADQRPASTTVEQIMTREVVACHPQDDISDAEALMAEHRKSRIMCLDDDDQLVGIISLSDIAQFDGGHAATTLNEISRRETRREVHS
jgi:CBS domain-containing protein